MTERRGYVDFSVKLLDNDDESVTLQINGSDFTWIVDVVERIHNNDASSEAHWRKEHPLEDAIMLKAERRGLHTACEGIIRDLQMLEISDGRIIRLERKTYSFANTVRRMFMTRIPVLAIDTVIIKKNDSSTQDEILAHRLGQVALAFSTEEEQGSIYIHAQQGEQRVVVAGDLTFPTVRVASGEENIPLGCIPSNGVLELTAKTRVSTGLRHAKYMAVASVPLIPEIELKSVSDEQRELLDAGGFCCQENHVVFRHDGTVVRAERVAEILGNDAIVDPPKNFTLIVEPLGQLDAQACLNQARLVVIEEVQAALATIP